MVSKIPGSVYGGKISTGVSDDLLVAITVKFLDVSDVVKTNKNKLRSVLFYK